MAGMSEKITDQYYRDGLLKNLFEMQKRRIFTDVSLKFRDNYIYAHKLVLSAASEVFAAMFQTQMRETQEGKVDLSTVYNQQDLLQEFINYIYTGVVTLTESNLEGFLAFSSYFMMTDLKQKCCDFLEKHLYQSNVLPILSIASHYECFQLRNKCMELIEEDFENVIEDESFLHTNNETIVNVLSTDGIEIKSEDTVLLVYLKWLDFDWIARSKYVNQIFQCVRMSYLSEKCYDLLLSRLYTISIKSNLPGVFVNNGNVFIDKDLTKNVPRHCLDTSTVIMTTGGYDGNSCLVSSFAFLPNECNWTHLAPMRISRYDHGTVSKGNDLYVAGGFNSMKGPLNSTEHYNSLKNKWRELGPMHHKRKSLGICLYKEKLFVSGGLDENYNALESVEYFDEQSKSWQLFTFMNQARYNHGFVGSSEYGLFTIGGWKCSTVERCIGNRWQMVAPMSNSRAGATNVIYGHHIFVCGGYSNTQCVNSLEIYDINNDSWTQAAPASVARWRAGSAITNKTIYIIGGRNSSWQYLDTVESYDIESGQWNFETPLPCKLMGLKCSVISVPKHHVKKKDVCEDGITECKGITL